MISAVGSTSFHEGQKDDALLSDDMAGLHGFLDVQDLNVTDLLPMCLIKVRRPFESLSSLVGPRRRSYTSTSRLLSKTSAQKAVGELRARSKSFEVRLSKTTTVKCPGVFVEKWAGI